MFLREADTMNEPKSHGVIKKSLAFLDSDSSVNLSEEYHRQVIGYRQNFMLLSKGSTSN
jgi:hypothetical protein